MVADPVAPTVRRRDAEVNRRRILATAAEAFAAEGLGVSMVEIARRAGVGNATVHRNFACKEALLEELFEQWFADRSAAASEALTHPDPWLGLVGFLESTLAATAHNRAASELYAMRTRMGERLTGSLRKLVKRAQAAGAMRADITVPDLVLLIVGIGRTIDITAVVAPEQWRRHFAIAMAGVRAPSDYSMPGKAIDQRTLDEALRAWSDPLVGRHASPAG